MSKPAQALPVPPRAGVSRTSAERGTRQRTLSELRRALVLDAARAAFAELGLEGTSLREIARRAGYTPGALYSYFESKEEVYGALLGESLERLRLAIAAAGELQFASRGKRAAQDRVRAQARAFFGFYRENPRDLDLGFYLYQGMRPRGLTEALNARLNQRLSDALEPLRSGLAALGLDRATAEREVTSLFAHSVGLLLLDHTGRIRMFREDAGHLFELYLDNLIARSLGRPRT